MRILALLLVPVFLLLAAPADVAPVAWAQAAPADSTIANAMKDLDRLENQAKALSPSRSSGANRIQKLLGLTEQRLQSSANKDHPSWQAANQRITDLKQFLADIVAGKQPGATGSVPVQSAAPVAPAGDIDPKIAAAMTELARIDAATDAMAAGDKTTGRQLVNDLNKVAGALKAYPDRSDPAWAKAAETYNALNKKVVAKANAPAQAAPAAAPAPSTAQPAPAQPAPASPATQDTAAAESAARMNAALRRMRELEVSAERVTPAMPDQAIAIVKQLNEMPKMVNANADKSHPRWQELVDRHGKLKTAMLSLATGAYAARMASATSGLIRKLQATDHAKVKEAAETEKWRKIIADGRERMSTLPDQNHANVAALGGRLDELQKLLEEKLAFVPKPLFTIDNIWNGDWPMDKPVLIDTIGPIETTVLVQMHVGRPATWVPEPTLLVRFPAYETDDVIVMEVMDGGTAIGKPMKCKSESFVKELALAYFSCRPGKAFGMTATGTFDLKLTYVQTLLQKEHNLAMLTLPVKELKHGARNNPEIVYGDDMDARLNVSTIEETGGSGGPVALAGAASGKFGRYGHNALITAFDDANSVPHAMIRTWFKAGKNMIATKLTCFKDDKKIAEADSSSHDTRGIWTYGADGQEYETWVRTHYELYNLVFRPRYGGDRTGFTEDRYFFLSDHPGEYRCVVTGNGEILKELYFTVGDDGIIEKPACQDKSMKTLRHLTLLRQANKKIAFVPYNENAGKDRGYFGNAKWASGCPPMQ